MYNRYIPGAGGYTRVVVDEDLSTPKRAQEHAAQQKQAHSRQRERGAGTNTARDMFRNLSAPLNFLGGEDKNAGMAGILKSLHLEDLDSGDILLLLIILFLFLEGDNIELVITLGLMLLLGLGDEKKDDQKE